MERHRINFLEEEQNTVEQNQFHQQEPEKPKKKRSVFFICFILIFVLVGFLGAKAIFSPNDKGLAYDDVTLEAKKPKGFLNRIKNLVFGSEPVLAGHEDDRINILLLGMGGPGHDGPYLTDTIIIGSLRPSTKEVAMITIPRDLGVEIPGYGWRKINHANAYGEAKDPGNGGEFAKKIISETFDIPIHYYGRIDFKAFEEIIDAVGGVKVNVDKTFTDREYPAPNDKYQVVSFKKGEQTMNGDTALKFSRSRHGSNGEGSDFARSKRQLKVILALKEKVLSFATLANPIKLKNIYTSLDKHITTDMEFSEIVDIMQLSRELDTDNITTLTLDSSPEGFLQNGYSPSGAFILEPKTKNFDQIRYTIANIFDEDIILSAGNTNIETTSDIPEQTPPSLDEASIEVLNGTWRVGLASRTKKRLEDNNFIVTEVGNTEKRPVLSSGIYIISPSTPQEIPSALKKELDIPIKQNLASSTIFSEGVDIVVILGEDFKE